MPGLAVCLLGAPHIERDSALVVFERRRTLALLAYLAVERSAVSREALAALFWPDMDGERGRAAVRHTLVDLQHGIGKGRLTLTGDQVALAEGPDLAVDVTRFRGLLAAVAEHHHPPGRLCDVCLASLSEAAALYRGDFLAGFTLSGSDEFDTWQTYQTECLRSELATALEALALALGSRGDHRAGLGHARRWLALDPLCEPAHRALMRLYADSGKHAASLRQYDECVRVLSAELGIAPDPETTSLRDEIKNGTRERRAFSAPPAPDNLPADITPFIGREPELVQIAERLAHPACRLLTVMGPGGMGKTRLAVQAARPQIERFDHGVCFIDLAPVPTADLLPEAILRSLSVPQHAGSSAGQQVIDYLAGRHMLLLLDNCEHLLDGITFLADLLAAAPRVKVLATSRARLNLHGEWLAPLEGLQLPHPDEASLEASDATALFLDCIRRLQPNYQPDADDGSQIVRLCRLLDGIPLAIELAAGWTRAVPLDEIAGEISRDLAFLATRDRDVPARMRSMQATFEHSWRLLDNSQQSLLSQMSVFHGGFTREAVQAATGAEPHDLQGLVDASWLRLTPGGRYAMHELIRQYCAARLTDEDSKSAANEREVRRRHCAYFAGLLDIHAMPIWRGQDPADLVQPELGNLLAAWDWAAEASDLGLLRRLARGFTGVIQPTGWYRELLASVKPVVARLRKRIAVLDRNAPIPTEREATAAALAWALLCETLCDGNLGPFEQALDCADECLRLIPGDPAVSLWGELLLLVPIFRWLMPSYLGRSRECLRKSPALLADLQRLKARFGTRVGDVDVEDGLTLCSMWMGIMLMEVGRYEEASAAIEERIAWAERTGSAWQKLSATYNQIVCLQALGEYGRAEATTREILRLAQSHGDRVGVAFALSCLGSLANAQGHPEAALALCGRALPVIREAGEYGPIVSTLKELGAAELARGRPIEAERHFADGWDILLRTGEAGTVSRAGILLGQGHVALHRRDIARARGCYREAMSGLEPDAADKADALRGMAGVLLLEGDTAGAARLLALVIRSPLTPQPVRTLAGRSFQALAPRMSPEQLATAVEWAEGRDLEGALLESLPAPLLRLPAAEIADT
jgi:predicted ATPase/DNA-binding SARP family transcriptional activator